MDTSLNLYAILGLLPDAKPGEVRDAYRILARRFHPDVNRNEGAEVQFQEIAAAYEVLSNTSRRMRYDANRYQYTGEPDYFSLRVTPSKRVLMMMDEPQVLYLLVEILPLQQPVSERLRSTPLNLTIVLDRSTSMRGIRLEQVKHAAHQIIAQLTPDDVLSVVSFSDRADVMIEAQRVHNPASMQSIVSIMQAGGGTEIYQGLLAGIGQCRRYRDPNMVNHVILITDGRTFGDEAISLELASKVQKEGIGISAMGIGEEWNDQFLDDLASRTGGMSAYINSPMAVVRFLNERVRSLGRSFVERLSLSVALDADITLESAFKLLPDSQPLSITPQAIPLGNLERNRTSSVLLQLQMPPGKRAGFRTIARIDVTGDVLSTTRQGYKAITDLSIELSPDPPFEEPPLAVMHALGKLTLYRMQQKAEKALENGQVREATQRLENLATRLLSAGQEDLAQMALSEARRVSQTNMLSEQGRKALKFGTRRLLALAEPGDHMS